MPAHDEEDRIERAVRSVLEGDLADVEVVVCLDHCSDGTEAALRRMGDPRVVWVANDGPPGIGPALNAAARAARSDLWARLDADDGHAADRLPAHVDRLVPRGLDVCLGSAP